MSFRNHCDFSKESVHSTIDECHSWKTGDQIILKACDALGGTISKDSLSDQVEKLDFVTGQIIEIKYHIRWLNVTEQPVHEYDSTNPIFMKGQRPSEFHPLRRSRTNSTERASSSMNMVPLVRSSRELSGSSKRSNSDCSIDRPLKNRRTGSHTFREQDSDCLAALGQVLDLKLKAAEILDRSQSQCDGPIQVLEVVDGGLCDGLILVGDIISAVGDRLSDEKVVTLHAIFEFCKKSSEILFYVSRMKDSGAEEEKLILVRKPIDREALTPQQVHKQIVDGRERRENNRFLLEIFDRFSVWSDEEVKTSNIPCNQAITVLKEIGIDPSLAFHEPPHLHGCDYLTYEAFKQYVFDALKSIDDASIRTAFAAHSQNDNISEHHLPSSLKNLALSEKHRGSIVSYFKLRAMDDHTISLDEFRQAILATVQLPDEEDLRMVFEKHAIPGPYRYIPKEMFREALEEAGTVTTEQQLSHLERLVRLNHADIVRFSAFKEMATLQTPLEAWAATLPLSSILADALPKHPECDHLRVIGSLTPEEIELIADGFSAALKDVLSLHVCTLKVTIVAMDEHALKPCIYPKKKFEVSKMEGGKVEDFHAGMEARIGACHNDFLDLMEAEHCKRNGSDHKFSVKNDAKKRYETTPRTEWNIVMRLEPCPDKGGRKVPDIDELLNMCISTKSKLSRAEVVGIVLYTGPMYYVYNVIQRKHPAEEYEVFQGFQNCFEATITVLASAIQKISQEMKVPRGLVLYRGLGGTSDLPDSFYKADENGCTGFLEYGFMSTTAKMEVAIVFSGVKANMPLPIILAIQVGALDRGACIRDFSQFQGQLEYLYVPYSFLEQSGPEHLEVTTAGIVRIIPVKASANRKIEMVEVIEEKKRKMHLETFRYYIRETESILRGIALRENADERLAQDKHSSSLFTVQSFINRIVGQCQEIYSRHEKVHYSDYNKDTSTLYSLVLEMLDVRDMAICKLREWLENKQSSFLRFRFNSPLRTVHRRWIAFLERELRNHPDDPKLTLELLKARRLIVDSVQEKNDLGETRLMSAAAEGRSEFILKQLIEASAAVNGTRDDGVSPIWLAAQFGHAHAIETLLRHNAALDHQANDGATPIYIAAQSGNTECISLLADKKADVNKPDHYGKTPIHQAAMNGNLETVKLLQNLNADVNSKNLDGFTPLDLAIQSGQSCIEALRMCGLQASNHLSSLPTRKLIISTGDVGDVDGFLALAEYCKTGADVVFIMNYPGYIDVTEVGSDFAERHPGLGFKYSAKEVLEASCEGAPESYLEFISRYSRYPENEKMKRVLTDIGFHLANSVWKECICEGEASNKGSLFFCIGGINSVIPFSQSAIKNEALVYSNLLLRDGVNYQLEPKQRNLYDSQGAACVLDWASYSDIYMDFNGSMAFWDSIWEKDLDSVSGKLRGIFVMGGVYSGEVPCTLPSIPNVLNRFSSATMNQLYHPENSAKFFSFVLQYQLKVFVVTNNVVKDLKSSVEVDGMFVPTYEGVEKFLESNGLRGSFLVCLADLHYNSRYRPDKKPYDFYTALALRTWMESGHSHEVLTFSTKSMFYSNVYGMTYVSARSCWEEARAEYMRVTDTALEVDDSLELQSMKSNFFREQQVLSQITYLSQPLQVHDLHFEMDPATFKLRIVPAAN